LGGVGGKPGKRAIIGITAFKYIENIFKKHPIAMKRQKSLMVANFNLYWKESPIESRI
jgi:hypothetical protein